MEHFAESRFWRATAVALVAALFSLAWAVSGERTLLPVAHAGGVVVGPPGVVYTTSEAGDQLYVWYTGGGNPYPFEHWSYGTGTVTRKPVARFDQQIGPSQPLPPPAQPGGFPGAPGQPRPGGPGAGTPGDDGRWERPR
jgi:hypothetical protein